MYEYVKKSEYAPAQKEIEEIIKRLQREIRGKYGLKFQFKLIGSGQNHLITRVCKGNSGYDFDYNLIISPPGKGGYHKADVLKQQFMNSLKTALKGTQYSFPKNSTSAITIKVIDRNNKKICHSCDLAIIYYGNNGENKGYYYLKNNKKRDLYEFVFRILNYDVDKKVMEICKENNGWNYIRDEYLKLKNINEGKEKRSFSIYIEAVNNIYNQMYL